MTGIDWIGNSLAYAMFFMIAVPVITVTFFNQTTYLRKRLLWQAIFLSLIAFSAAAFLTVIAIRNFQDLALIFLLIYCVSLLILILRNFRKA